MHPGNSVSGTAARVAESRRDNCPIGGANQRKGRHATAQAPTMAFKASERQDTNMDSLPPSFLHRDSEAELRIAVLLLLLLLLLLS